MATSVTVPWSLVSENLRGLSRCKRSFQCSALGLATPKHSSSFASAAKPCTHNVIPEPFLWAIATCWHLLKVHCWPMFCSSKFWGQEMFQLVSPACFVCDADCRAVEDQTSLYFHSSLGCGDTTAGLEKGGFPLSFFNKRMKSITMLFLSFFFFLMLEAA